jgi:hypothetical protein
MSWNHRTSKISATVNNPRPPAIFTLAGNPAYALPMKTLTTTIIAIGICFVATGASAEQKAADGQR